MHLYPSDMEKHVSVYQLYFDDPSLVLRPHQWTFSLGNFFHDFRLQILPFHLRGDPTHWNRLFGDASPFWSSVEIETWVRKSEIQSLFDSRQHKKTRRSFNSPIESLFLFFFILCAFSFKAKMDSLPQKLTP